MLGLWLVELSPKLLSSFKRFIQGVKLALGRHVS